MRRCVFLSGVLGLAAGCTGPMVEGTIFEYQKRPDPEVARLSVDSQQMGAEFRQLSEQIAALMRNQEVLEARLSRVEMQAGAPQGQEDIAALRRDIQMLRTERESLRGEITTDLAGRIEKIAARQQSEINAARSAATAAAARQTARAASGYEHKVEPGQTLSEIARGYGKSIEVIMKANKITNASMLRAGQVLFIPD